jgi:lipid-binding SYLF domain-containing protein
MQRRNFLKHTGMAAGSLVIGSLVGCGSTATTSATNRKESQDASSGGKQAEIRAGADAAVARLEAQYPGTNELLNKAAGVLVFPRVISAGLTIGGQFGDGVLKEKTKVVDYYRLISGSFGLQIGAQSKAMYFLFMTQDALERFKASKGWSAGGDASVAVATAGADGRLDLSAVKGPVIAFVLTNAGLMANLTLEGTKISKIE